MKNAGRVGCGHEECTTGGIQDMRNAQHNRGRTREMYDRRDAGHKECTKGWVQDMMNARQEGCRR